MHANVMSQLPFVIFFNAMDAVRFLDFIISISHSMHHLPASYCALTLQTNELFTEVYDILCF